MKKIIILTGIFIFTLFFVLSTSTSTESYANKNYVSVIVKCSKGKVIVKNITGKKSFVLEAKTETEKITGKILISTEKNSEAVVQLFLPTINDTVVVKLFQSSQLYVLSPGQVTSYLLKLEQGKVNAKLKLAKGNKDLFKIKTPIAVAAARGTEYTVEFDESGNAYFGEDKEKILKKFKVNMNVQVDEGVVELLELKSKKGIKLFGEDMFITPTKGKNHVFGLSR